jgi:hypothetical protein
MILSFFLEPASVGLDTDVGVGLGVGVRVGVRVGVGVGVGVNVGVGVAVGVSVGVAVGVGVGVIVGVAVSVGKGVCVIPEAVIGAFVPSTATDGVCCTKETVSSGGNVIFAWLFEPLLFCEKI